MRRRAEWWSRVVWVVVIAAAMAGGSAAGERVGMSPEQAGAQVATAAVVGASREARDPVLERVLRVWPEGRVDTLKHPGEWSYEEGTLLDGVAAEWRATGDGQLFAYIQAAVDRSVNPDGAIHLGEGAGFPAEAHSLDNLEMGRSVMLLYRVLQLPRYYRAAAYLEAQLRAQPTNASGGYWHKGIYPDQMWLDGAYMAEPFQESYGRTFEDAKATDAAAAQLLLMESKLRDRQTGLLRHGWDASHKMGWANKKTGLSEEVWARAMGWYAMAVVDVLEQMPASDPQRAALEEVARRTLGAVVRYQDPASGLWWEVMDKGGERGNYLEASASCMFVYALAKGIRLGVAPPERVESVERGWAGVQKHFVKPDGTLSGTVSVGGLGGTPYRDGSYGYYLKEPVVDNDAKGVGAYLLALSEVTWERRAGAMLRRARGRTVLLDAWFNSQRRKTPAGNEQYFHYKWSDDANSGYSTWARMFAAYGLRTEELDHAPRAEDLKGVGVYVIVSPDIPRFNPKPNYMDPESAAAVEAWVKAGGMLVMMENDSEHADQVHLDELSDRFGMHYNPVTRNRELNNDYANTMVTIPAGTGGIFSAEHHAVMKETCTLTLSGPARAILTVPAAQDEGPAGPETPAGDVFMAVARVGRGLVFANVDPWVYNEYTDGRRLPLGEDNFAGGLELTRWIVGQMLAGPR